MSHNRFITRISTLVALLIWSVTMWGAEYATQRLKRIGQQIENTKPKFAITTRTNEWGDIEHIGLKLFSDDMRRQFPSPCYDFLERHMLELNIVRGTEEEIILLQKPVFFTVGTYRTALQVDSTFDYRADEIEFHRYMSTWSKGGHDVLQVIYDMDYQLMSGCNISELEESFIKRMKRHFVTQTDTLPERGTYIISPSINNNLYIDHSRKEDGGVSRSYIFDGKQGSRSVANLMLADDMQTDVTLQMRVNRYNYKTDTVEVALQSFLNFCRTEEGCTPYFAIKRYRGENYEGLLLMANRNAGYMHMLSVTISQKIIEEKEGVITGRIMVYIPLHNVNQEYLNLTEYETNNANDSIADPQKDE